jgi:hypothetical protein
LFQPVLKRCNFLRFYNSQFASLMIGDAGVCQRH